MRDSVAWPHPTGSLMDSHHYPERHLVCSRLLWILVRMKRPSASMKRPSSSINEMVAKLQRGVSSNDLDNNQGEGEAGDEQGRDKTKGQKYVKMMDSLPDHVIDLVEKESKKASSPRDFKTMCINKLFVKNPETGKLELNLGDDLFTQHKKMYSKKYAKEEDTALPESIMKGLYFRGDQKEFDKAIADGDVTQVDCGNGKTYYAFTSFKKGKIQGTIDEQDYVTKSKITKEQGKLLSTAFASVGWTWNYAEKDVKAFADGKPIPDSILNLVKQASDSQTRLAKEGMSLIKAWPLKKDDERLLRLKKGHTSCQTNLAKLGHMKEFQELPDDLPSTKKNLDALMQEMATHTQAYNELIESTRGSLKALKN